MYIFGDESGSITKPHSSEQPFFVVGLVKVNDMKNLRRSFKRFVSSNIGELRRLDGTREKMFRNGSFLELKGSEMDREMKSRFVEYFGRKRDIEVFYIEIDNRTIPEEFSANPAEAFNYIMCLNFKDLFSKDLLPEENCFICLDERNESSRSRHFLEVYLNTELALEGYSEKRFSVEYFDSRSNFGVQLADVFSNLYYSNLINGLYDDLIEELSSRGIIRNVFRFPLDKKEESLGTL